MPTTILIECTFNRHIQAIKIASVFDFVGCIGKILGFRRVIYPQTFIRL